jgi:predicted phosphodiesterase
MRALVIGDLHFQNNSEVDFFTMFIAKIEKLLSKGKYDYCILLGDIRHKFKNDDRVTQTLVCNLFNVITTHCQLYVLVGNHDMDDSQQFLTENHTLVSFKKWPKITIVDKPIFTKLQNLPVVFCPYVPKGRFLEALKTVDYKSAKIIFAHQEMQGCQMGGLVSIDGDHWSEELPMIISGHIHNKHQVGENIIYTGTPYDLGWDESEKRYVMDLTYTDSLKIGYILSSMPRKIILRLSYKEALVWQIPEGRDYYKLKICCTKSEYLDFAKTRKDLKGKVKLLHISSDEKRVEQFLLEKKKIGASLDYKTIFANMVEKENDVVKKIYNKIIGQ